MGGGKKEEYKETEDRRQPSSLRLCRVKGDGMGNA